MFHFQTFEEEKAGRKLAEKNDEENNLKTTSK